MTRGAKDEVFNFSKRRRQSVTPRAPRRDASGDDGDVVDDTVHVIAVVSVIVVGNGATRLVYETHDAADVETTKSKRRHRRRWEEEETPGVVVVGE